MFKEILINCSQKKKKKKQGFDIITPNVAKMCFKVFIFLFFYFTKQSVSKLSTLHLDEVRFEPFQNVYFIL